MSKAKNADQLRDAIDRGKAGDKVAYPDPAAAPLGTDDEAAGTPPQPDEVRQAMRQERRGRERGPAETDAHASPHGPGSGPTPYPAIKARGAEINLKTRTQRIVFFGGAVLGLLIVLLLIALWKP
jgi:hypothetical protein